MASSYTLFEPENGVDATLPYSLPVDVHVTDPELMREILGQPEGDARDAYILCALRIGALALKQARGQIDGDTIKREGDRLLQSLEGHLNLHSRSLNDQITNVLKDYFDPESGRLQERIQNLVKQDGELERVLRRHLGEEDSALCRTLAAHVGKESPLMRMLSPRESEGLLMTLSETIGAALTDQRTRVLEQFSLDNQDGALSRLVRTLHEQHGDLNRGLQTRLDEVVKEFSLDKEDSALSRLVHRVTEAQRTISAEFSLDNDNSALSRMSRRLQTTSEAIDNNLTLDNEQSALCRLKRELLELLTSHSESNQKFQEEVKRALDEMKIRREESRRSTLHGIHFEEVVFEYIQKDCQQAGEIATWTGDSVGSIKNCKIGDAVIEMGPEHVAAGARIVIEAKDKDGYNLTKARAEIEEARKNREAGIGLFIFAQSTAPEGLTPFQRLGEDVFVVWDPEDVQSDVYLRAGVMVARALCARQAKQRENADVDLSGIEKAVNNIEKKAESLDEIRTAAQSINSGADKILNRVRIVREGIERELSDLRDRVADLKAFVNGELPQTI